MTDMAEEELSHEHQLDEIATPGECLQGGWHCARVVSHILLLKILPRGHGARSTDRCKLEQHFRIICAVTGVTDDVC